MNATLSILSNSSRSNGSTVVAWNDADRRASNDAVPEIEPAESGSFDSVMATMRSSMGRSLGLRSVDRELEGRMFKPAPRDAQSVRRIQARDDRAADQFRGARQLRARAANGAEMNAVPTVYGPHSTQPIVANNAKSPSFSETETSTANGVGSAPYGSGMTTMGQPGLSAAPRSGTGAGAEPPALHMGQASGIESTVTEAANGLAVAPAVSGASTIGASGSTAGVADQVGKVLQYGSMAETGSARAASAAPSAARTGGDDQTSKQGVQRQESARASDATPTRTETARLSEPTPFDELVRSIKLRTQPHLSSARIRLDPPELGQLQVDVRLTGDQLELNVRTETAEAARLVRHRVGELAAALEHHGIRVDATGIRVEVNSPMAQGNPFAGMDSTSPDGTRRDDSGWRFESGKRGGQLGDTDEPWTSVEAGRFWGGFEWSTLPKGRVDVRV